VPPIAGGGAIGIAVSATVVNERTNLHFLRVAEHLNFWNTEPAGWLRRMTSHYIQAWGDPMIGQTAALKKLWEAAYREAQVQAFADAYLVIAVCFVMSAMMVPLMRGVTPKYDEMVPAMRWPCSLDCPHAVMEARHDPTPRPRQNRPDRCRHRRTKLSFVYA
jgi:hypothetical protein